MISLLHMYDILQPLRAENRKSIPDEARLKARLKFLNVPKHAYQGKKEMNVN